MSSVFIFAPVLIVVALLLLHWWLGGGEDLSRYDRPVDEAGTETFSTPGGPSESHQQAVAAIESSGSGLASLSTGEMIRWVRDFMDRIPSGMKIDAEFRPVECDGVAAEWVLAPGADPKRRVLYTHGGAFFAGSPKSHRTLTAKFSAVARASVLSVDYRLVPENRRKDSIVDCRTAYRWLLENGPEGPCELSTLFLGGDSAGGNLALMLSAWSRDEGLHAPHAVVAFSPTTDSTFLAPSLRENMESDVLVRSLSAPLQRMPTSLLRWTSLLVNRMRPSNPSISPVFGDLSGLPATLIQVSDCEMLYDDARRYVNKARQAGSPVCLQTWSGLMHAWPLFYPQVAEAHESWQRVAEFLEKAEQGERFGVGG